MTWNGLAADYANPVSASEQNCQDGVNCDTFKLTVSGTQADWAGKTVHIQIDWLSPTFDYALSVHKGTNADPSIASSDNPIDAPRNWEAVDINPSVSGVGDYSVHVIYFTTSALDPYKGSKHRNSDASFDSAARINRSGCALFQHHAPQGLGTGAGEPSIGVNPATGKVFFQSNTQTLRITFDDSSPRERLGKIERAERRHQPRRLVSPTSAPGVPSRRNWPAPPASCPSAMTMGKRGRPVRARASRPQWITRRSAAVPCSSANARCKFYLYKNAVYYCSQDLGVDASCAVSLDGGLTFGPAVRIYTQLDCDAGLHGHIKVAADGTAYVPSKGCGGQQAVVVSENNGLTWDVRKVPQH